MPFSIRPQIRRAFRLALRRRDLTEREIDEEMRFHVESRVEQLVARGVKREEAYQQARHRFGVSWEDAMQRVQDAAQARESRLRTRERLDAWWGDLSYASRTLARQPAFSLIVIATFALGIGANAAMFGVIDRLLLEPPPQVRDPSRLLEVARAVPRQGGTDYYTSVQYPFYAALRADSGAFRDVAAGSFIASETLGSGSSAEQLQAVFASSNYFRVLGTEPALGRLFGPTEDGEVPTSDVVVLSYGLWQRRFAADPKVIGTVLRIGPREFTVIGVAREEFTGVTPDRVDVWLPLSHARALGLVGPNAPESWGAVWLRVLVRLRDGVASRAAAARAQTLFTRGFDAWSGGAPKGMPAQMRQGSFVLRSIMPSTQLADDPKAKLARLLVGVTGLVLLIACANVASLLLARGTDRRREIAVRLALGVSRGRLLRLLFAETAVLAVCGGVAATLVAHWGIALLQATLLDRFAWTASAFDGRVIVVTTALVVAAIVLAGVVPTLRASRPDVVESIKAGGREGGVGLSRARTALMTAQAAVSVVLMVGAALFVRSLRQTATVQLGYQTAGVVGATIDVIPLGYKPPARLALYSAMRDRVAALPGVADVAVASTYPLQGYAYGMRVRVPGRDSLPTPPNALGPTYNAVSSEYFSTLGIRVVDGRPLLPSDLGSATRVAVISEAMARAYWPGERAVDRCIMLIADSVCTTVVGVVANARVTITDDDWRFDIYVPMGAEWHAGANALLVRARDGDADRLVEPIRRAMQSTAPNLPYAEVQTFDAMFAPEVRPWRTGATLFSLCGALALAIAAIGLYSAISYGVAQRRHEFGVRMALGAQIADVVRLVMDQGIRAALVGAVIGSVAAMLSGGFIAPLLFQTSPRTPSAFALAATIIVVVAAVASFFPAWRASRVDPVAALRAD